MRSVSLSSLGDGRDPVEDGGFSFTSTIGMSPTVNITSLNMTFALRWRDMLGCGLHTRVGSPLPCDLGRFSAAYR